MKDLFSEVRKQEEERKVIQMSSAKNNFVKSLVRMSILNKINLKKKDNSNVRD